MFIYKQNQFKLNPIKSIKILFTKYKHMFSTWVSTSLRQSHYLLLSCERGILRHHHVPLYASLTEHSRPQEYWPCFPKWPLMQPFLPQTVHSSHHLICLSIRNLILNIFTHKL